MTIDKDSKIKYADFKSIKKDKPSIDMELHTNPVIDRLFKFVHTKLSDKKNPSNFKPEDLL